MNIKKIISEEILKLQNNHALSKSEGVGDKYAERKWNIPDEDNKYKNQTDIVVQKPDMGKLVGYIDDKYNKESNEPIYLNPKSLNNFDIFVRAVSDVNGNLYVAQHDGDFVHSGFGTTLNVDSLDVYEITKYLGWHRIRKTNKFGFSDSTEHNHEQAMMLGDDETLKKVNQNLEMVKRKNPQFEFIEKLYYDLI